MVAVAILLLAVSPTVDPDVAAAVATVLACAGIEPAAAVPEPPAPAQTRSPPKKPAAPPQVVAPPATRCPGGVCPTYPAWPRWRGWR